MGRREYINWPGEGLYPGEDLTPGWQKTVDEDVEIVHSHSGSEWERVRDEQVASIAALGAASVAASGGRTVDLSQVVSSGVMERQTAQTVAALSGQFLTIGTHQLTVSGVASIETAVVQEMWGKIVHAQQGEFEQITANMISAGAIDGQVITGATLQTAKAGARIVINSQGMAAYRTDGSKTLSIDARTGSIEIDGRLGITDTWSYARLVDVTYSGSDSDADGWKTGVALDFNRTSSPWRNSGRVVILQRPNGGGQLWTQAPSDSAGLPPRTILDDTGFGVYASSMSSVLGTSSWSVNTGSGRVFLDASRFYAKFGDNTLQMTENQFLVTTAGNATRGTYIGQSSFSVRPSSYTDRSVWASSTMVVIGYDGDHYSWWGSGGMNTIGGKNFVMHVPGLTEAKGGMLLRHASTESPWHGIEDWANVTLDADGRGTWALPNYVEKIASPVAPRCVLASDGARAVLVTEPGAWRIDVEGEPGAAVSVLLKLGRVIEEAQQPDGSWTWHDPSVETLWVPDMPYRPEDLPSDEAERVDALGDALVAGPLPRPADVA